MQLFYAPELRGDRYTLNDQESKHCIKVLRMKQGDRITLTNGAGTLFTAELVNEDPRHCEVQIIERTESYGRRDYNIHVAIAPTKNISRFEWFLEKATEIGIDEITPLVCRRSERRVIKRERLEKVITAAMKQSLKAYHPRLNDQTDFIDFIHAERAGKKFIAYVEEGRHPLLQSMYEAGEDVCILVGPEGDFSPEEVKTAMEKGFQTVSLGNSRLRTETAGVLACHTIMLINEQ